MSCVRTSMASLEGSSASCYIRCVRIPHIVPSITNKGHQQRRPKETECAVVELLKDFDTLELRRCLESFEIAVLDFSDKANPAPLHLDIPRRYWFESSDGGLYSADIGDKSDSNSHSDFIRAEVESLERLRQAAPKLVPETPHYRHRQCGELGRPLIICEFGQFNPEWSSAFATTLGRRLAQEVHTSVHVSDGFGSCHATYYRGLKIVDRHYTSWKECYEALIVNLLSHLRSEEYSELRRQVGKAIKR